MSMPARKMRVELLDGDGNRYTVAFEGQVTREKAVRLLELVELLGGMPSEGGSKVPPGSDFVERAVSKYEKVHKVVQRSFPLTWFSSKDVQNAYEQEFKEPLALSTVATYLSRLSAKGLLTRTGALNSLKYRLSEEYSGSRVGQAAQEQTLQNFTRTKLPRSRSSSG
jgi:predicted transcriptional regulator